MSPLLMSKTINVYGFLLYPAALKNLFQNLQRKVDEDHSTAQHTNIY